MFYLITLLGYYKTMLKTKFTFHYLTLLIAYSGFLSANTGKTYIIEPYIGAEYGTWSQNQTITSGSTQTTYNLEGNSLGYFFGAKAFYIWRGMFLIGADYQMGSITQKYAQDENTTVDDNFQDASGSTSGGGLSFGVFKDLWSFKFSYFPINKLVTEKGIVTGNSELTYSGSAIIFNFSYTIRPMVNLNLEYVANSYSELESGSSSTAIPGSLGGVAYGDQSNTSFRLYTSFPF